MLERKLGHASHKVIPRSRQNKIKLKKIPNPNRKIGIWNFKPINYRDGIYFIIPLNL